MTENTLRFRLQCTSRLRYFVAMTTTNATLIDRILNHPERKGRSAFDITPEEVIDTDDDITEFHALIAAGIICKWPVGFATHRVDCRALEARARR